MDTSVLKKFAQAARRQQLEQVAARMEQVLQIDSVEIREKEKAVKELQEQIGESSKEAVIDRVAYTWFNRFCALRFMDVNHYTPIGIVSPVEGFTQPEILQEAKQGVIDDSFKVDNQRVFNLLNGQLPSSHPQQEAYRLLIVGACNAYHKQMPFLFPKIDDFTELLMPDDLLSENSVLQGIRDALITETCEDVEVIGWLYQFYISEKKEGVIGSKKKIHPEDIPTATQLFTPHWIVRYLVENTLGRLWLLNRPDSKLIDQMDYYIRPEQADADFLEITSPEEIKICDPACGSGHMLTYAFDLLYDIYEEQGYDPAQIPKLILQNNLYGIEIDKRAGDLAAFALVMKARTKDRRFLIRGVEPNIIVMQNITFTSGELDSYKKAIGPDLFNQTLWETLKQFEEAKIFGSLIRPIVRDAAQMRVNLKDNGMVNDLFMHNTHEKILCVLEMAEYLNPRYHVVLANPPYMGGHNMCSELKEFLEEHYKDVKSDLFSTFIMRNLELTLPKGQLGFMSPFVWMFISSYEKLRRYLIDFKSITSLIQLEYSGFAGATVPICTFTLENAYHPDYQGGYVRLSKFRGPAKQAPKALEAIHDPNCGWFFRTKATEFNKIPGSPIAYWVSNQVRSVFKSGIPLGKFAKPRQGLATADNARFVRLWNEVSYKNIGFNMSSREEARFSGLKWFPFNKGGKYRKWYGNNEFTINWESDGKDLANFSKSVIRNPQYHFQEGITWTAISSSYFAVRYCTQGSIGSNAGMMIFSQSPPELLNLLAFLNSRLTEYLVSCLSQTLNFDQGVISRIPILKIPENRYINSIISITKVDWDSFETSYDFTSVPLLLQENCDPDIAQAYATLRKQWKEMTNKLKHLEEDNNRNFLEIYRLQSELIPDVPLHEITLTCNPHYRYPNTSRHTYTEAEHEAMLLEDTMKEFISYAVGCMFGRYSLDKPGLIIATAGETVKDYFKQVPESVYAPDIDNVIPVLEGEWFEDDIAERFKGFIRVTFGTENFDENLSFLESAIGKDIRTYFIKDFYKEHVKMYKKRPIYWLFSSPNGSFNALIYMHRYRPDTISVILNNYLRQYRDKLKAHQAHQEAIERNPSASQREVTKATKEIIQVNKLLAELKEYEDEILYPLATQQIEIDLDDGVKVNYNKFGMALKKVPGLSGS